MEGIGEELYEIGRDPNNPVRLAVRNYLKKNPQSDILRLGNDTNYIIAGQGFLENMSMSGINAEQAWAAVDAEALMPSMKQKERMEHLCRSVHHFLYSHDLNPLKYFNLCGFVRDDTNDIYTAFGNAGYTRKEIRKAVNREWKAYVKNTLKQKSGYNKLIERIDSIFS